MLGNEQTLRLERTASDNALTTTTSRIASMDGLRGFALIGMMAWHAEVSWVKGGFARMTVFFVLAGYLAARSALRIADAHGGGEIRIGDWAKFWVRRSRRLMPVTALGVLVSVLCTWLIGASSSAGTFWDSVATLTSWENWRLILSGNQYGALFESASAFQHYWSLSVEEQCFVAAPVILAVVFRMSMSVRARATALIGLSIVLSGLPLAWVQSPDTVYYGTHVRLGEFAAGMALAVLVASWSGSVPESVVRVSRVSAPLGLAVLGIVMLTIPRDLEWIYRGGMGLMVLPVGALLLGLVAKERHTSALLGQRPLAWIGRAAFPIYAVHWPLFLVIDHIVGDLPRQGAADAAIVVTKFAVALVVGGALHRWYERPLMNANDASVRGLGVSALSPMGWTASLAVLALLMAGDVRMAPSAIDFDSADDRSQVLAIQAQAGASTDGSDADSPPRVLLFGGSSALMMGLGGFAWWAQNPNAGIVFGSGDSVLGCGLIDTGFIDTDPIVVDPDDSGVGAIEPACVNRTERWRRAIEKDAALGETGPVVAMVAASLWDIHDHLDAPGGERWIPGTSRYESELAKALDAAITVMRSNGVSYVVFTTLPSADPRREEADRVEFERRAQIYAEQVRLAVERANAAPRSSADRFEKAVVIDVGAETAKRSGAELLQMYPDGIHLTESSGADLWNSLLAPSLRDAGIA